MRKLLIRLIHRPHPSSGRLKIATTDWTAIFLLFPSFDHFLSVWRRTDFQLISSDFDLSWRLWHDGVVLLAKNAVPKNLDWTDLGIDRTDWLRESDKVRQEPSAGTTN